MVTVVNSVLYTWNLLRVDPKCSNHTHTKGNCKVICVLICLIVVNNSQSLCLSNLVIYFLLFFVNYASVKLEKLFCNANHFLWGFCYVGWLVDLILISLFPSFSNYAPLFLVFKNFVYLSWYFISPYPQVR